MLFLLTMFGPDISSARMERWIRIWWRSDRVQRHQGSGSSSVFATLSFTTVLTLNFGSSAL